MKKILLPFLLTLYVAGIAQPKLVGTLKDNGVKDGGAIFRTNLPATTPGVIHSFDNSLPHWPSGGVCMGDANRLYGITSRGGSLNYGALYRINQDGSNFTTIFNLTGGYNSLFLPYYHTDGKIYFNDALLIKSYDPSTGNIVSLPTPGTSCNKNLLIDSDDWIYYLENANNTRLVKMKTDGSIWDDLYNFNDVTEGFYGRGGVIEIPGDSLLGTLSFGGVNSGGSIYSIRKDGTGFAILHQFSNATGEFPESGLRYFDGKIFGSTSSGGNEGQGVLFCINPDGSNYRVLHHFTASTPSYSAPSGNISISSNGRIFGSFFNFWFTSDYWRLFKVDTSGDNFEGFTIGSSSVQIQRDFGDMNQDILLLDNEDIYFTTGQMGRHDGGTLNYCDTSGNGSNLYHFGFSSNGFRPQMEGLIKGSDGKLYGTATIGGAAGNGTIFYVNADGTGYTKIHEFTDAEGYEPTGRLLEASDGKLYGVCRWGGFFESGCIYRLDKTGSNFQVIYSFDPSSGSYNPVGSLIEDNAGWLHGATFWGGIGFGNLFKINKSGTNFTTVKTFGVGELNYPYNGVTRSGDYLYGACGYGGAANKGGIFRIKTDGSLYQVLHEFTGSPDGELPVGIPLVASNGKVYGTTSFGGNASGDGIIFSIDGTGSNYTILKTFTSFTEGGFPWSAMIQGSDGKIYGSTQAGGTGGGGTIFSMNLDGSNFTVIRSFAISTEGSSVSTLLDLNGPFVVLPVHLLSFTAQKRTPGVLLSWKTVQEQNSDHFEIERSADGNSFNTIGSVPAAGNTNSITSYSFTDPRPLDDINFYRLKQVDSDGAFTYSKIITINFNGLVKLFVSPNPASQYLNIRLPQNNDFTALSIFDASGKLVMQKNMGSQSNNFQVGIQHLPKGWYLLKLTGKENLQQPFIKE